MQLPKFGAKRGGIDVSEVVETGKRGRPADRLKELNDQVCSRRSSQCLKIPSLPRDTNGLIVRTPVYAY
jgi:hypothetical protein